MTSFGQFKRKLDKCRRNDEKNVRCEVVIKINTILSRKRGSAFGSLSAMISITASIEHTCNYLIIQENALFSAKLLKKLNNFLLQFFLEKVGKKCTENIVLTGHILHCFSNLNPLHNDSI